MAKMSKLDKLLIGFVSTVVFGYSIAVSGHYLWESGVRSKSPTSASYRDSNRDGYEDIVVTSRDGTQTIFYGQQDGNYLSPNQVRGREEAKLEKSLEVYQPTSQNAER